MLSPSVRRLTYLVALLNAILGAALFLLPGSLAPVFAWKVSPFVTMTIGGWCLGNAWLAWTCARRWEWPLVYTSLLYLAIFGAAETVVLLAFRDKLALGHPIAWLCLATLAVHLLAAMVRIVSWSRLRPGRPAFGPPAKAHHRAFALVFVLFVGFLALYGSLVPLGAPGTNAGIFPEPMSLFTLRSFAAFYLSLALAAVPLIWERNLATGLHHSLASYGLIVAITAAAIANLGLFDFRERPGGLLYLGAYFAVGVPLIFAFVRMGTGKASEVTTDRAD
jgi:hypothetical protein